VRTAPSGCGTPRPAQPALVGHDGFADVDISPDGRYLVSSDGTTARVWALDLDEFVSLAESRLTRALTEAECVSYHVETCPARSDPPEQR
jgi:hypothetical protein